MVAVSIIYELESIKSLIVKQYFRGLQDILFIFHLIYITHWILFLFFVGICNCPNKCNTYIFKQQPHLQHVLMAKCIRLVPLPVLSPVTTTRMFHLPALYNVQLVASVLKGWWNMGMDVWPHQTVPVSHAVKRYNHFIKMWLIFPGKFQVHTMHVNIRPFNVFLNATQW